MTVGSRFCPLVNVVRDVVSRVEGRGSSSSRMDPGASSPRLGVSGGGGAPAQQIRGGWVEDCRSHGLLGLRTAAEYAVEEGGVAGLEVD